MEITVTLQPPAEPAVDVRIRAEPGTPLRSVADALRAQAGGAGAALFSGRAEAAGDAGLGGPGLRDGDVLGVGAPVCSAPERPGALELRVTGGPAAGGTYPLPRGRVVLGRGSDADVGLDDPVVSRRHLAVEVGAAGVHVRDLGSTNGSRLDGVPLGPRPVPLEPGQVVRLGESTIVLADAVRSPIALRPDGAGGLAVDRPPRLLPGPFEVDIELPAEPAGPEPARLPLLTTASTVGFAAGGAMALHAAGPLVLSLLSPLVLLAAAGGQRWRGVRRWRRQRADHRTSVAAAEAGLAAAVAEDARRQREAAPDPAAVGRTAVGRQVRLWERRATDADSLLLRVGTADRPARVRCRDAGAALPQTAPAVPVTVNLGEIGVLGITGPRPPLESLVRFLVGQLATLRSPADLSLVLLAGDRTAAGWAWLRWLPHLRWAALDRSGSASGRHSGRRGSRS